MPIKNFDNEVIAVIQVIKKTDNRDTENKSDCFNDNDILVII